MVNHAVAVRLPLMHALRAFDAAARERSLTRAAEALNVTHGAISHQIKSLEADLGVRLTQRAGRGIRLTVEGERFASRVRAAFGGSFAAAVHEITSRANPRLLRVSVVPSFAARWLLPRMGSFLAACPDVDLDVRSNMSNVDFDRDDADVAIRYGNGDWPRVTAEHLLDDRFFPCVQSAHPRRSQAAGAGRPRGLHAAPLGRRAVETVVRCRRTRLARAFARTDLQRLVADAAGRRGGSGRGARPRFAPGARHPQRGARAAFRRHGAGATQVLARLSAEDGGFAQARDVPEMAARRDCVGGTRRAASFAARREASKRRRRGRGTPALALPPLAPSPHDASRWQRRHESAASPVAWHGPFSFTLTFSILFPMNEVMGINITTGRVLGRRDFGCRSSWARPRTVSGACACAGVLRAHLAVAHAVAYTGRPARMTQHDDTHVSQPGIPAPVTDRPAS